MVQLLDYADGFPAWAISEVNGAPGRPGHEPPVHLLEVLLLPALQLRNPCEFTLNRDHFKHSHAEPLHLLASGLPRQGGVEIQHLG